MFVYDERDGLPVFNFQYVDDLFDFLLDTGVRPFVEFGFSPRALARETDGVFWWKGHGSPPTDLGRWANLVDRVVRHWVDRYGLDEVSRWYFEVWNEPNLYPFFRGSQSEYFALYEATVTAVKAISPTLRVGGPATSNFVPDGRFDGEFEDESKHGLVRAAAEAGTLDQLEWRPVWVEAFLSWCANHSLPVDFVSAHPYPTDWPLDEHGNGLRLTRGKDATPTDLRTLRRIVDASAYPDAEIHLTEWSSSSSPRDHTHDFLQAATFVVRANLHALHLADSLSYWVFTDVFEENGAGNAAFHGGFGMMTYQGVRKPVFTAYRFLNALGDQLVDWREDSVVTRDSMTGTVAVLAYNYPDDVETSVPASWDDRRQAEETLSQGTPRVFDATIVGLRPGDRYRVQLLDRSHGDVVHAWQTLRSPASPTIDQIATLREVGRDNDTGTLTVNDEGSLHILAELEPWALLSVSPL